jgi:hypothetical protein
MPSDALGKLSDDLSEVVDLQSANLILRGGLPRKPQVVRAVNRSSVVLLYSYFERYLRQVNEEALDLVNEQEIEPQRIPEILRLEHSSVAIDEMYAIQWPHRSRKLAEFVKQEAWLWGPAPVAQLDPDRLLR